MSDERQEGEHPAEQPKLPERTAEHAEPIAPLVTMTDQDVADLQRNRFFLLGGGGGV